MTRQEKLNSIFEQFDKSSKKFCDETDGLFCEISSEYKGEACPENLKFRFAKIYYNSFVVRFVYTAHLPLNTINSILECYVSFGKSDGAIEIPLPLATDYCDKNIMAPLCIPFITNSEGMEQSFDCIGGVLKGMLEEFAEISCSAEREEKILSTYANEIKYIFDLKDTDEVVDNADEIIRRFFTLRFVSAPFINFIKGKREKTVKQLKKTKKLIGYEKRIIELYSSHDCEKNSNLSAITVNADMYNERGVQKVNMKEFFAFFSSWIILSVPLSAVYLGLFFLLVYFEGRGSVCLLGPMYNFPICIFFGFLTAVEVSYFARFKFYRLLYKKDYEKYREMDYTANSRGSDNVMKVFCVIIVLVGIVGCLLFSKWNINFKHDGFVDNSKFLSLSGEFYSYSEIDYVYYKADRVNDFGDTLDFPSYVLVMKNGKDIDLYEHGEIEDYEKELMEFLADKGVKIHRENGSHAA